MNGHEQPRDGTPSPPPSAEGYDALLHEAGAVADKALCRLRRLSKRYPSSVPGRELEQLQRARAYPAAERRGMVRLEGGLTPVGVRIAAPPGPPTEARVIDRSAGGVGLRLDRSAETGAVLGVQLPGEAGTPDWFFALVRHCRRDGDGWVVGCEFLGERPPA